MTLIERFSQLSAPKFSFAKSGEHTQAFARDCNAFSMYDQGWGFGFPSSWSSINMLYGVFRQIITQNGTFLFNLSGVDLIKARRGFQHFEEAENNNQITEWELFMILTNKDI